MTIWASVLIGLRIGALFLTYDVVYFFASTCSFTKYLTP